MILLILCIILNALIGVAFKLFDKYGIDNFQAITVNYIVCVLTASVVAGGNPLPDNLLTLPWFKYAFLLGVIFIIVFNIMALTVQHFGMVITTIFQKMSLIAPALIAIIFFGETSSFLKWFGIIASVLSIILLSYQKNNERKSVLSKWVLMLPILTFLFSCVIDSSIFLIQYHGLVNNGDPGFVATLFLSAGFTGFVILIIQYLRGKVKFRLKNLVGGIALGVPNFFSIYLLLLVLANGWGGSVVFPINNVGVLSVSAVFGLFIFNERLTNIKLTGFAVAVIAIVLIAIS
ncbi:MAG: hypothetical protein IPM42_19080 [Saprospiraceae bacterium]|nr:hypothetical protein [Saprospiraceae bacterium]